MECLAQSQERILKKLPFKSLTALTGILRGSLFFFSTDRIDYSEALLMDESTSFNIHTLVRNPEAVKGSLKLVGDKLVTLEDADIYVPVRFEIAGLLSISTTISVVGIFPIVIGKQYTLCSVNAMITINPAFFRKVEIEQSKYYQFHFNKNTPIFSQTALVQADGIIFSIFNEFIAKGNVPWYIEYEDYGKLFDTAKAYANSNIASSPELMQLLVSMQSRSQKNRNVYYHTTIESYSQLKKDPPVFIPLKSVVFSASTTLNKLAGSYFKDGVVSALANPTERVERLEFLLKA